MKTSVNFSKFYPAIKDQYVFRVKADKNGDKTITAERKGVWTWIKARILCPKEYRLGTILAALLGVQNNDANLLVIKQRINLAKYNRNHQAAKIDEIYNTVFPIVLTSSPPSAAPTVAPAVLVTRTVTDDQINKIAQLLKNVKREAPLAFQVAGKAYVG
jgi:hypothetical protein